MFVHVYKNTNHVPCYITQICGIVHTFYEVWKERMYLLCTHSYHDVSAVHRTGQLDLPVVVVALFQLFTPCKYINQYMLVS